MSQTLDKVDPRWSEALSNSPIAVLRLLAVPMQAEEEEEEGQTDEQSNN